jgi:hypothetical protein
MRYPDASPEHVFSSQSHPTTRARQRLHHMMIVDYDRQHVKRGQVKTNKPQGDASEVEAAQRIVVRGNASHDCGLGRGHTGSARIATAALAAGTGRR